MPLSTLRVSKSYVASLRRQACIVAAGKFGDNFCLFKNRDRNYLPKIKVVHEVRGGVEVAYLEDETTGWVEGLNAHGLGIVNAALMVSRDESERDVVERTGKKLPDGEQLLQALQEETVAAAAKSVRSYRGGLKGHTLISDGKKTVYVEMPDSNAVEYDEVPEGRVFVRTNHGVEFPDTGYVGDEREKSSKSRQHETEEVLSEVADPEDVGPALLRAREDRWEPTEMVRDHKSDRKMRTTTQMVLDLTEKRLLLYLFPGRVDFLGVEARLPDGFKPGITIEVLEYEDLKEETDAKTEPVRKTKKASGQGLLPILDPAFNIREVFKQLVLLEDHLAQPRKRCVDCIWKHLLTAEALAEEGVTLDVERKHGVVLDGLAEKVRVLQRKVQDGVPMGDIASEARLLRKTLLGVASSVRVARAKFDHACDHNGISYGWISPGGRVHVLSGYGHAAWAKDYLEEHPEVMRGESIDAYGPEGVLLRKGWLQVTNSTAVMAWDESSAMSAAWEAMAEIVVGCVLGGQINPERDTVWVAFDRSSRRVTPADFVEEYGGRRLSEQMFEGLMSKRVASKHLTGAQVTVPDGMRIIDNAGYKDLTGIRRIPVARSSDGQVVVGNEAIDEAGARISGKPYMTDAVMAKLFDGSPLVVSEKVDGHPTIILYGGYTFFCEGLRVQHSVDYDNVPYSLDGWPDMAVVYDVLDGELEPPYSKGQGTGKWLTRLEQEMLCSSVGAPIVPLVWEGHVEPEDLPKLADRISSFSGGSKAEGIVLKNYRTGVFGKFINLEFQSRLSDESLHPGGVHPMQRGVKNIRRWATDEVPLVAEPVPEGWRQPWGYFQPGDLIYHGKFQNKPGQIKRMFFDPRGIPMIEVVPVGHPRRKPRVISLYRVRHVNLPKRVASAWLREAKEWPSQDALDAHLKEHPGADPKDHWVKKQEEDTGQDEKTTHSRFSFGEPLDGYRPPEDAPEFDGGSKEWVEENTIRTPGGSLIMGTPHAGEGEASDKFHKEQLAPAVHKVIREALAAGKKVVFLAEGGVGGPGDDSEQTQASKAIQKEFGKKVKQDTFDDDGVRFDKEVRNEEKSDDKNEVTDLAFDEGAPAAKKLIEHFKNPALVEAGLFGAMWDQMAEQDPEMENPFRLSPAARKVFEKKGIDFDDPKSLKKMWDDDELADVGEANARIRDERMARKVREVEEGGGVAVAIPGAQHAYMLKHVLEGSKPKGKTATTPSDVHDLADDLDIPWDDDPDFMAFCEQVVGETHLDDMSPEELGEVADALKRSKEAGDSGPRYKEKKEVPKADGSGKTTVYVYSERQVQNRNREKAERVEKLRHSIEDLREQVGKDVDSDEPKKRLTALAVALIDATFERVGNESSADEGHFGVTGWLKKHVTFGKGKATVKYVGKSGVDHEKVVTEKWLVDALRDCCADKKPDEALLSFGKDDADGPVRVTSRDVNAYLEPFEVTAKDLRGYHANTQMQENLRAVRKRGPKLPRDRKEKDKVLKAEFKEALEKTAEAVGHEASTLKSQYLVPGLEDQYIKDGTVEDTLKKAGSGQLWYHLTDRAKFKLDPKFTPADNALAIEDRSGQAGIYLGADVERWVHGYGYWRPFVVEVRVDPSVKDDPGVGGRWGGELFVPATSFDKVEVVRVIPIDAWAREQYNDYGWVESALGRTFDTGEPIVEPGWDQPRKRPFPGGYRYPGPDVREMPASESSRLRKDLRGAKGRLASVLRVASSWMRGASTHYVPLKIVRARDYPMPEKPTRVWEWSLGQAPPSSLSRPRYGNSLPADEGHDWKWRAGVFRYSGTGGRGEAWLILQFGPDAQGEEKVCSSCGVSMPDHARFCPSCGMAQKVATKTPGEREDEEAERLVRPSPKLKPPRDDRKREKMQVESDPDLKGSDKDLSLNYKDVGG